MRYVVLICLLALMGVSVTKADTWTIEDINRLTAEQIADYKELQDIIDQANIVRERIILTESSTGTFSSSDRILLQSHLYTAQLLIVEMRARGQDLWNTIESQRNHHCAGLMVSTLVCKQLTDHYQENVTATLMLGGKYREVTFKIEDLSEVFTSAW